MCSRPFHLALQQARKSLFSIFVFCFPCLGSRASAYGLCCPHSTLTHPWLSLPVISPPVLPLRAFGVPCLCSCHLINPPSPPSPTRALLPAGRGAAARFCTHPSPRVPSCLQAEALLPVFAHILSFSRDEERACRANLERLQQVCAPSADGHHPWADACACAYAARPQACSGSACMSLQHCVCVRVCACTCVRCRPSGVQKEDAQLEPVRVCTQNKCACMRARVCMCALKTSVRACARAVCGQVRMLPAPKRAAGARACALDTVCAPMCACVSVFLVKTYPLCICLPVCMCAVRLPNAPALCCAAQIQAFLPQCVLCSARAACCASTAHTALFRSAPCLPSPFS